MFGIEQTDPCHYRSPSVSLRYLVTPNSVCLRTPQVTQIYLGSPVVLGLMFVWKTPFFDGF